MNRLLKLLSLLFDKRKKLKHYRMGKKGEINVYKHIQRKGYGRCLLHDVIVRNPYDGKMAQIDIAVVSRTGVVLIEVKTQNFKKMVGHVNDDNWVVIYGNNVRFHINNVYKQAIKQKEVISSLLKRHNVYLPIYSVVFIQNQNKNVTIEIEGLKSVHSHAHVKFTQSLEDMNWRQIDTRPHKLAMAVLRGDDDKNQFVRRHK